MKSARVITKTNKRAKTLANDGDASVPVIKIKAPVKKSSSKLLKKINARTQFKGIKEALAEVELIEAGKVKPKPLKEALNEL